MFQPLNDNVLLKEIREEVSPGGIHMPITERSNALPVEIVAVSLKGLKVEEKKQRMRLLGKRALVPVDLILDAKIDGEDFLLAKEKDLLGVFEK